jgi:hypothetical protein
MNNLPVTLEKLKSTSYEMKHILLMENLNTLTTSKDENLKAKCWDSIQNFYKQ